MATKNEIEKIQLRNTKDLCKIVELIGYNQEPRQLQCSNGAYVSSLIHFFDDNPGAMECLQNWILENHAEKDEDEDEDEDEEEDV